MATTEEIMQMRRYIGDTVEPYTYNDEELGLMIDDAEGNVRKAASDFWYAKATSYSEMVDITEAGSSRKNSDLFKNAMQLAKQYDDTDGVDPNAPAPSTTRRIVRR